MKRFISGMIIGALGAGIVSVGAVGVWDNISVLKNDINVVVNGENITADNFLYQDTTYLPLRAVSEALGETVEYDEAANTAYIGERSDSVTAKSKYIPPETIINNQEMVYVVDDIYYVTTWFLENEIGIKPGFDYDNNMFIIIFKDGTEVRYPMSFYNGRTGLPYDTYVDEIEPLLR